MKILVVEIHCVSLYIVNNILIYFRGAVPPGARFDPFGPPGTGPG